MFEPEVLVFMIPIVAIVLGFASKMANRMYEHEEKMALCDDNVAKAELEGLSNMADILDRRVAVLERILDDEVPDWREGFEARARKIEMERSL